MVFVVAFILFIGAALLWRWSSRRWSLPCPTWLAWVLKSPAFYSQRTLDRIGLQPGQRILEIGPGPGRLLIPAAARVAPHGEALGMDVQAGMIDRLRTGAARAELTNVTGIVGDASKTAAPGQFDIVILAHVLGEIPDRAATLTGCFRALKPGGVLSISELVLDPHFVSQHAVRDLAHRAGFHDRETHGSWLSFTANFEKPRTRPVAPRRSVSAADRRDRGAQRPAQDWSRSTNQ